MSADRFQEAENLYRLGRACVLSKSRAEGYRHLQRALHINRHHADAWFWLAAASDDPAEQKQCLEWAVACNPAHSAAKKALGLLTGKIDPADVRPAPAPGAEPAAPTPAPAPVSAATRRAFTCPQCGGRLRFDPEIIDLKCDHCGFVEVVAEDPLREAELPLDFALPTQRAHEWSASERLYACGQCGAHTLLPPGVTSAECPFCAAPALVQAADETATLPPQGIIPMAFTAEQAQARLRHWLSDSWLAPNNLLALARSPQLHPAYVPFWTFNATLEAHWSAEVRVGSGKYARWEQRHGSRIKFFTEELAPGLKALPDDLLRGILPFDLKHLLVFKPEYLAAWPTALYDRPLAEASLLARERMVQAARRDLLITAAPGQTVRNLEVSTGAFTGQTFKLVLLPVWLGAYTYQGQTFRVAVNGQTGQVHGHKPIDNGKVALLAAAGLALLALLGTALWLWMQRQ